MATDKSLYEKAVGLRSIIIEAATYHRENEAGSASDAYIKIRRELFEIPKCKLQMPEFVMNSHTLEEICIFIKEPQFHDDVIPIPYKVRIKRINQYFAPFLRALQAENELPLEQEIIAILENTDSNRVNLAWQKVLDRRNEDLDGAITAARTLLETVCKYVLDKNNISFKDNCNFSELYRLTAASLNLTPNAETEGFMKQLMDGCLMVISSIGSLRNHLGDAHGKREHFIDAKQQHAELIVNITCSVALFLIATWEGLNIEKSADRC